MKNLFYILILVPYLIACNGNTNTNDSLEDIQEAQDKDDSLVTYYEQEILDYYHSANGNDNDIEFDLTGRRANEDDSILILSFDEILKFGSWHYSNSSLLFHKENGMLFPISPSANKDTLLSDFFQKDIQYPNRINGILHEMVDLTDNHLNEFVFICHGVVRTNFEKKFEIYHVDWNNKTAKRDDLFIWSTGIQAECDTSYGELSSYKIISYIPSGNHKVVPVIEIKHTVSRCNTDSLKVEDVNTKYSYFAWNIIEEKFEELIVKN